MQFENKNARSKFHYGLSYNKKDNKPRNQFEKELYALKQDARNIRDISFIMKTVMGNACYSDKERDAQISKGEKIGNLDDVELKMLNNGWDVRKKLASKLMTDFGLLIKKVDV